jgi:hypothetical protein
LAERADVLLNAVSLTVDPTVVSTDGPINPHSRMSLELKNFGRTRAQNVACRIGLVIPGVPGSVPPREPFILGPGATQLVLFQTFKETLTKKTYEDIASGVIDLKIAGTVIYEDIFGESHTIACKGVLDPRTGHFIMSDAVTKDLARVMTRVKAIYRSWAIPCSGKQVYARCHRAEWLGKIHEPGVHRRAKFYDQQLDALRVLRA